MLEVILNNRLEDHFGHQRIQERFLHIVAETEFIFKTFLLQLDVGYDMIQLILNGDNLLVIVHAVTHHLSQRRQ
ncbi:hypothetical protein D3C80_1162960 [compost metagenome]